MKHPVVVGLQFGDEGKGKLTDFLARDAAWVIRFNGGSNAGHTLHVGGKKVVTHSVPSGVLYPKCRNFIGSGCVLEPLAFRKELQELSAAGISVHGRLWIDYRVHLTAPLHRAIEAIREAGSKKVGTTRKGIGPTYATKAFRTGIRMGDFVGSSWEEKLRDLFESFGALVQGLEMDEAQYDFNFDVLSKARSELSPFVSRDPAPFASVSENQKCVLEGAQAVMLDIDHGTYPFVTSSHTVGAYAPVGVPFPYRRVGASVGVAKAYLTRVGEGPFPSELPEDQADRIRMKGGEFGATTGRPRRVGWLNLDELRTAMLLGDCEHIFLTKSDILSGEKEVKVMWQGKLHVFPGWESVLRADGKLDSALESYLQFIEQKTNGTVIGLGTGPERESMFWRRPFSFWEN